MLTEEELRNGVINTASRWPNKTVPFFIDPVFSKYSSTKVKGGVLGMEGVPL